MLSRQMLQYFAFEGNLTKLLFLLNFKLIRILKPKKQNQPIFAFAMQFFLKQKLKRERHLKGTLRKQSNKHHNS